MRSPSVSQAARAAKAIALAVALVPLVSGCRWKDESPTAESPAEGTPRSFASLVKRLLPTVVGVYTQADSELEQSLGTGVIIDPEGQVLTNEHVIAERSERIQVRFADGHRAPAHLLGRDRDTDVALLQIDGAPRRLPAAPLGDSDRVEVGEWVLAIGQPFGLTHSVTAGILSAKGRTAADMQADTRGHGYWYYLQTDASINPGNSGGPLIDMRGTVIGINTMIHQEQRMSRVGFAIPITLIKILLPQLRRGELVRSWLGVEAEALDPDDPATPIIPGGHGVRVRGVRDGSPAQGAALRPGDVILAFAGHSVASEAELRWLASTTAPGSRVGVRVFRGGKTEEIEVKMARKPEETRGGGPSTGGH